MDPKHIAELRSLAGDPSRVILNPQIVEQLSRDFYWYSPVLRKQLDGKLGEAELAGEMAKNTRALVKKQRTWFRTQLPVHQVLRADEVPAGDLFVE